MRLNKNGFKEGSVCGKEALLLENVCILKKHYANPKFSECHCFIIIIIIIIIVEETET